MVRLSLDSECECGIFCVWKKNGMQRLMVGARCINQRRKRPHQCDSALEMVWRDWSSRPRCTCTLPCKLTGGIGPGPRELALADVSEDVVHGEWKNVPRRLLSPSLWRLLWSSRRLVLSDSSQRSRSCSVRCQISLRSRNGGQRQRHLVLGDSKALS